MPSEKKNNQKTIMTRTALLIKIIITMAGKRLLYKLAL
jgi:hypothetical protein